MILPVGLFGKLMLTSFVFGWMADFNASRSSDQPVVQSSATPVVEQIASGTLSAA